MKTVKLSKKFQIVIPRSIRNKTGISVGDTLIIDTEGEKINLTPLSGNYSEYTRNLHSKIWKNVDIGKYIKNERKSWDKKVKNIDIVILEELL